MGERDTRASWRTAFSVLFAFSVYVLFSPKSGVPADVAVSDKVIHGGLFALLGLTGAMAGLSRRTVLVGLLVYAVVSEILQAVLPIGRDGDVLDALADAIGVLVGVGVSVVVARALHERRP